MLQLVCDTISTGALACIPLLQKELFDSFSEISINYLILWGIVYLAFVGAFNLFEYFSDIFTFKGIVKFEFEFKRDYFSSIINMEDERFRQNDEADYLSMDNNDITEIGDDYLQSSIDLIRNTIGLIIYGVVMVRCVHSIFVILVMILCVILIVLADIAGQKLGKTLNVFLEKLKKYNSVFIDLLQGKQLVNSVTIKKLLGVHQDRLNDNAKYRFKYGRNKTRNIAVYQFIVNVIEFITITACGVMAIKGDMTVGTCIATLSYVSCFIGPVQGISDDIHSRKTVYPLIEKIGKYMDAGGENDKFEVIPTGNLVLEKVTFWRGKCLLDDLNYIFEAKKKYCIIGDSGVGKTMLLNIISSKIIPDRGNVTVGNCPIVNCRSDIFYVNQNAHIFHADFFDNTSIFGSFVLDEEIESALRSILGDERYSIISQSRDCTLLSGGEKQIVSFTRCLFSKCEYILLDEPFSAVDIETRKKMLKYLCELKKTIIMVTHDSSDLPYFDTILLLEQGKLVEKANNKKEC